MSSLADTSTVSSPLQVLSVCTQTPKSLWVRTADDSNHIMQSISSPTDATVSCSCSPQSDYRSRTGVCKSVSTKLPLVAAGSLSPPVRLRSTDAGLLRSPPVQIGVL